MSTKVNLGPVVPQAKGDWSASTTYGKLDIVRYADSSWICNVASSKGVTPSSSSTDWELLIAPSFPDNCVTTNTAQVITGAKAFDSSVQINTTLDGSNRLRFKLTDLTKGTFPTDLYVFSIGYWDYASTPLAGIQTRIASAGSISSALYAYANDADSTTYNLLGVTTNPDGTGFGYCPIPTSDSNTNHIATTSWVRSRINAFVTCTTAASNPAKTASYSGFLLTTGEKIAIRFKTSNTADNPTLNINNTGAIPIYYHNDAVPANYLSAGRMYIMVYDGNQYEIVGDIDTDAHVKQVYTSSDSNVKYPILLSYNQTDTTTKNAASRFTSDITVTPSTSRISAKGIACIKPSNTFVQCLQDNGAALVPSSTIKGEFFPVISFPSTNGGFGVAGYKEGFRVYYINQSNIDNNINAATYNWIFQENGALSTNGGFIGNLEGNATSADKLSSAKQISLTGDVNGMNTFDGSASCVITTSIGDSGVAQGSYGPTAAVTATPGSSFYVPSFTVGLDGRLTNAVARKVSMPSSLAISNVTDLQSTLDAKLPLAGGTMTGTIKAAESAISRGASDGILRIFGGTNNTTGSSLILFGKDNTTYTGRFILRANDGTTLTDLQGIAGGALTWNGKVLIDNASNQQIKGDKVFLTDIKIKNTGPYLSMLESRIPAAGENTNTSSGSYSGINLKTTADYAVNLAEIKSVTFSSGTTRTYMTSYNNAAESADRVKGEISVTTSHNGTVTTSAPTPASSATGTEIATASFVNTRLQTYLGSAYNTLTFANGYSLWIA